MRLQIWQVGRLYEADWLEELLLPQPGVPRPSPARPKPPRSWSPQPEPPEPPRLKPPRPKQPWAATRAVVGSGVGVRTFASSILDSSQIRSACSSSRENESNLERVRMEVWNGRYSMGVHPKCEEWDHLHLQGQHMQRVYQPNASSVGDNLARRRPLSLDFGVVSWLRRCESGIKKHTVAQEQSKQTWKCSVQQHRVGQVQTMWSLSKWEILIFDSPLRILRINSSGELAIVVT